MEGFCPGLNGVQLSLLKELLRVPSQVFWASRARGTNVHVLDGARLNWWRSGGTPAITQGNTRFCRTLIPPRLPLILCTCHDTSS